MQSAEAGVSDFLLKKTLDINVLTHSIFYSIQRRKAELKSEKSEESYRALLEILPAALVRLDPSGYFNFANDKFGNMLGCNPKSLVGKKFEDFMDPATARKINACNNEVAANNTHIEMEISPSILGESPNPILYAANAVQDVNGDSRGVQCILFDISTQKKIQTDKHSQKILESLQRGLANLANELNNAFTPILLNAEILRNSNSTKENAKISVQLEEAIEEARSVLRPFLFSSQEVGARSELLDLRKILQGSISKFKSELASDIKFETDIETDIDFVNGDASLLNKMFNNLITNAFEAYEHGGIVHIELKQRTIGEADREIQSMALTGGTYLVVVISDKGCGMHPNMVQRSFEPFYTTKGEPHVGTGMTEALGIIKSHHGNMIIENEAGVGTALRIYIPAAACKLNLTGESLNQPQKHILLVDDEENVLDAMEALLKLKGHEVFKASNGAEALGKFNEQRFNIDLVITDYDMPVMDGAALIKTLRQIAPSLKIILCTGIEVKSQTDNFDHLDVDEILLKPFNAQELSLAVSRCC